MADDYPIQWQQNTQDTARKALGYELNQPIVALLSGSRRNEYQYLMPTFIETARQLYQLRPDLVFIAPVVGDGEAWWTKQLKAQAATDLPIHIFKNQARTCIEAANVVLLASGTATLQTMLLKKPMVIAYKMAKFNYWIAKRWIKIPYIGLPNLLANEQLVPERIQDDATVDTLTQDVLSFLNNPDWDGRRRYTELHRALSRNASETAADAILKLFKAPMVER